MTTRNVDFPDGYTNETAPTVSGASWGGITGTLASQTDLAAALAAKASLASPALTGNPTAPTPSPGDNDTSIATTAFVTAAVAAAPGGVTSVYSRTGAVVAASGDYTASQVTNTPAGGIAATTVQAALNELDTEKANLASPTFTGTPAAPTATSGTSTTQIATTAFVGSEIARLGGGINYITDRDGSSIGSWSAYADSPGSNPVDGNGGSPVSTFAVSTDSSLAGTTNFLFTKGAANRQGEGFSVPFSIDAGYQAKPLKITALYKIASGTFVDNDMSVWVYDVTNSNLIACTPQFIKNSTGVEQISCEFQAAYNSTSYRLIFHVGSTSASAYSLRFDSFSVSPTVFIAGASISSPVAYTPVFTGFGTVASVNFRSWRDGKFLKIQGNFTTGTTTATEGRVTLGFGGVSGGVTSASTLPTVSQVGSYVVGANENNQTTVLIEPSIGYMTFGVGYASASGLAKANGNLVAGVGYVISLFAEIEIEGWGTSQVLSNETDTRIIAAKAYGTPANVSASQPVIFPTSQYDTHGAYNTSTGRYTCPSAGYYRVFYYMQSSNTNISTYVYKNGTISTSPSGFLTSQAIVTGEDTVLCSAGDILDVRPGGATGAMGASMVTFERISGPAQIAASEKVFLQYTGNAGSSITANTTNLDFTTKVNDSHGSFNGTVFTAPSSGIYNFNGSVLMTTSVASNYHLYINSVDKFTMSDDASRAQKHFSGSAYLNAGDTASVKSDQTCTLSNNTIYHWISITSQG